MKLTRRGRCFQEYFSSEVTVSLQAGGWGTWESRRSLLTSPGEKQKEAGVTGIRVEAEAEGQVKYLTLLSYDSFDLGQDVPLFQAAKQEGLDREHLSLVSALSQGLPVSRGRLGRAQLSASLPSSLYAGGPYHQAASQPPPTALVPSPSPASGCCPLIVYIPFSLCL